MLIIMSGERNTTIVLLPFFTLQGLNFCGNNVSNTYKIMCILRLHMDFTEIKIVCYMKKFAFKSCKFHANGAIYHIHLDDLHTDLDD